MSPWYRMIVLAFPAEFRTTFGPEVLFTINEQRRALGDAGFGARAQFHLEATADLVRAVAHARAPDAVRALGWLCIALSTLNVGYDLAMPKLSMGVLAWGITVIIASVGAKLASHSPERRRLG
jgi:hypothetical protein